MGPFRTIKIHMPNLSMTVQLLNNLCFPLLSSKGVAMKAFKKACRKIVSELMAISGNVFAEQPHIHLEKIEQLNDGYTQFAHKRERLPNCREIIKLYLCMVSFTVAFVQIEIKWCPCFYLRLFPDILEGNLDSGLCHSVVRLAQIQIQN